MIMSTIKNIIIFSLVISLIGCTKNPLLGKWKVKPGQNELFVMCHEIEFRENLTKCGSIVEEVEYEVDGNIVIVSSALGDSMGMKVAYEVLDHNTIQLEIPYAGKLTYGRSNY
jgi:hypothetical protein